MPHSSDSEAFESADEDVATKTPAKRAAPKATLAARTESLKLGSAEDKADAAAIPVAKSANRPIESSGKKESVSEPAEADGWDDWGDEEAESKAPEAAADKPKAELGADDSGWDNWSDEEANVEVAETKESPKSAPVPSASNSANDTATQIASKPNPLDRLAEPESGGSGGWSSWSPWGGVVTNLLSSASDGVASLTSQVTSVIGVPGPEEMARLQRAEKELAQKKHAEAGEEPAQESQESVANGAEAGDAQPSQLFGSLVSGVTQIGSRVLTGGTQIGSRVLTGGLDTLEGIGKKTMEVLQENDPGLRNKRRLLQLDGGQAPVLSQILREAKESTEAAEKNLELAQKQQYKKKLHFETLFDDYCGLVHLEALEMLSRQSQLKLQTLLTPLAGRALAELQETLDEVRELCDLGDADESGDGQHTADALRQRIAADTEDLGEQVDAADLAACWQRDSDWLLAEAGSEDGCDARTVYDRGLRCLAETTAMAVHKLHKLAELLLVKERHSTANEADALVQLVGTFCWHLSGVATRFGSQLSKLEKTSAENVNDLITSTFVEGSNSVLYIRNGFQLFVPILQLGAA